jgi:hypothetical protein
MLSSRCTPARLVGCLGCKKTFKTLSTHISQKEECRAHYTSTGSKTRKSTFALIGHDETTNVHQHGNNFVKVHNEGIVPGSTAAKGSTHNKASSFPMRGKDTFVEESGSVDNAVDEMADDDDNFPSRASLRGGGSG